MKLCPEIMVNGFQFLVISIMYLLFQKNKASYELSVSNRSVPVLRNVNKKRGEESPLVAALCEIYKLSKLLFRNFN